MLILSIPPSQCLLALTANVHVLDFIFFFGVKKNRHMPALHMSISERISCFAEQQIKTIACHLHDSVNWYTHFIYDTSHWFTFPTSFMSPNWSDATLAPGWLVMQRQTQSMNQRWEKKTNNTQAATRLKWIKCNFDFTTNKGYARISFFVFSAHITEILTSLSFRSH